MHRTRRRFCVRRPSCATGRALVSLPISRSSRPVSTAHGSPCGPRRQGSSKSTLPARMLRHAVVCDRGRPPRGGTSARACTSAAGSAHALAIFGYANRDVLIRYRGGAGMVSALLASSEKVVSGMYAAAVYVNMLDPLSEEAQIYIEEGWQQRVDSRHPIHGLAADLPGRVLVRALSSDNWGVCGRPPWPGQSSSRAAGRRCSLRPRRSLWICVPRRTRVNSVWPTPSSGASVTIVLPALVWPAGAGLGHPDERHREPRRRLDADRRPDSPAAPVGAPTRRCARTARCRSAL